MIKKKSGWMELHLLKVVVSVRTRRLRIHRKPLKWRQADRLCSGSFRLFDPVKRSEWPRHWWKSNRVRKACHIKRAFLPLGLHLHLHDPSKSVGFLDLTATIDAYFLLYRREKKRNKYPRKFLQSLQSTCILHRRMDPIRSLSFTASTAARLSITR